MNYLITDGFWGTVIILSWVSKRKHTRLQQRVANPWPHRQSWLKPMNHQTKRHNCGKGNWVIRVRGNKRQWGDCEQHTTFTCEIVKKQLQSTIKCDIQRTYSHCMEDKVILLGLWWKMCIQSSCSFPHAQTLNPRDVLSERSEKRLSGTRLVFCKEHLKLSCSPKLLKKEDTTAATRKKQRVRRDNHLGPIISMDSESGKNFPKKHLVTYTLWTEFYQRTNTNHSHIYFFQKMKNQRLGPVSKHSMRSELCIYPQTRERHYK